MKAVNCEGKLYRKEIDSELSEENIENLKSRDGKVKFKEMGQLIGSRWHNVTAEELTYCKSLAEGDKKRYQNELDTYVQKKENIRSEAHAFTEYERMMSQEQFQGPPFIQSTPSIKNEFHMRNVQSYKNSYGYEQMTMTTAPNHYCISPPNNEGYYRYNSLLPNEFSTMTTDPNHYCMSPPPPPNNEGQYRYNSLLPNESSTNHENESRFYLRNEHTSSSGYSQSYRFSSPPPHVLDATHYSYLIWTTGNT